jgi:hypothetical protein
MLETLEAWIGFVLVLIFFGTCLAWFLMWYGAGLARIPKSGFWRSLGAALFASVVVYLVTLAALVYGPPMKTVYGLAAGFILALAVIKVSYLTSFLRALVPWLFFLIAQAIVILAATELLIGDLADLLGMMA